MAFRAALRRFIKNANPKTNHHVFFSTEWAQPCHLNSKRSLRQSFAFTYSSNASKQKSLDVKTGDAQAQSSSPNVDANVEATAIKPIVAEAASFDFNPEHPEISSSSVSGVAFEQAAEHGRNPIEALENVDPLMSDLSVSVKPRVMPLPEDIMPEEAPSVDIKVGQTQTKGKQKKLIMFQQSDMEIFLPTLVPQESKKQKDPVALADAIKEIKASDRCAKFDQTVEAHVRLGVDPRRGDQMVRGAATLPHGTGKVVKVAVFAEGAAAEEAKAAGADVVGADDLVAEIFQSGGKLNFDKCIATPALMPKLGKVARILGPRGLMPNPKVGTVTNNVGEAVKAAKRGRVDFKADKTGIVHAGLGKVSFTEEALKDNIAAFTGALLAAKPVGLKKSSRYAGYFNSFTLSSTMGPGVPVTIQSLALVADNYMKTMET